MMVLALQYWGKKDIKNVNNIVAIGINVSLITSLIIGTALFIFPHQVLSLFSDKPLVIEAGIVYGRIISISYIFFCMSNVLISAFRCVEVVKIGMIASCSALVVTISLNWVLIFGNLGFPALGAMGAGISTLIARIVEFIVVLGYMIFKDKKLNFKFVYLFKVNKLLIIDFIKYGLPVTLGSVIWGINLAIQGSMIGRLDEAVIAAYSISYIFFNVITVAAYGSAAASSIVIGKAVGEGDIQKVKEYSVTLQVIFLIIGVVTGVIMYFSKGLIPLIYNNMTEETLKYATQFLIVLAVMSVGTSYQMATLTGIVRAGGDTNFVFNNDVTFIWAVELPLSYLAAFVFHWEPWVVVLCLKCDQILKCFVAVIKVNRFKWIKNLTRKELINIEEELT